MNIRNLLFVFISAISFNSILATEYYFSNSGDDSNNGLSPVYPMKSLSKLNSLMFKLRPGDAVLFERGNIFYGQININASGDENNPIVFGAYGNGRNPVISGSVPVNNWSIYKGNIYKSYVKSLVRDLFVNGERMTLARFPNSGYLRIDRPFKNPNTGFMDRDLNQANGYWDSSNVRIRTENWAYEHVFVSNFKNGSLTFSKPSYYSAKEDWGYYLDNCFDQLDMESEWYYDKYSNENNNLYLYAPNSSNPNTLNVQAGIFDCAFFSAIELTDIVIQDFEFQNQNIGGVYLAKKKSNVTINNCTFTGQNAYGIVIPSGSENISINNCRFYNINGKAIYILATNKTSATNNIFINIGMIPGYGTTGDAFPMSGVIIFGNNNRISGNYINMVGHNGINCIGTGNIIEKNILKNILMLLNDGGAIKCYGEQTNNCVWNNNFIFNVPGNLETTDNKNKVTIALGIYLDELANNMSILNNTITGSGSAAIGTNAGFDNIFKFNNCLDNAIGATFYQNKILCKNNTFENNFLFCNNEDQIAILNQSYYKSNVPGIFDNNHYYNSFFYNIFWNMENNIVRDMNIDGWRKFVRSDENSVQIDDKSTVSSKLFCNMSNDSATIILNQGINYKDKNLNNVYASISLQPWTSQILFADSKIDNFPEINIAGGPLIFNLNIIKRSDPLWFNITGNNLLDQITVTAPSGFLISFRNDIDFTNSLTFYPENGIADRIVYAIFDPSENMKYYDFITVESENVSSKIKITGVTN